MSARDKLERRKEISGVFAQNIAWFGAQGVPCIGKPACKFRITFAISSAVVVQVTLDNANYYSLNSNDAHIADSWYDYFLNARKGDVLNIRTNDAAGTTVRRCRIDEVNDEG